MINLVVPISIFMVFTLLYTIIRVVLRLSNSDIDGNFPNGVMLIGIGVVGIGITLMVGFIVISTVTDTINSQSNVTSVFSDVTFFPSLTPVSNCDISLTDSGFGLEINGDCTDKDIDNFKKEINKKPQYINTYQTINYSSTYEVLNYEDEMDILNQDFDTLNSLNGINDSIADMNLESI